MRKPIPAAIGAARVPRRSFKTAYTSKKTKTMSATLRGSTIRLKYSVYGSSSNISTVQKYEPAVLAVQCSSVKSVAKKSSKLSTDVFRDRLMFVGLIVARNFEKDHF